MSLWPIIWGLNASAPSGGVLGGCSGHLFGFSGLDGTTSESTDFVGVFASVNATAFDLRFCGLQERRTLTIALPGPFTKVWAASNDVLELSTGGANFSMAWA